MLRYSREIAFATAQIYAQTAELRGAWDARLEALIVDAVLRGEEDDAPLSRASTLGWAARTDITVMVGHVLNDDPEAVVYGMHRAGRHRPVAGYDGPGLSALAGVQGDRLIAVVGGVTGDPVVVLRALAGQFAPGPVVIGPVVGELTAASRSAEAALSGLRAAVASGRTRRARCCRRPAARAGDRGRRARSRLSAGGDLQTPVRSRLGSAGDALGLSGAGGKKNIKFKLSLFYIYKSNNKSK